MRDTELMFILSIKLLSFDSNGKSYYLDRHFGVITLSCDCLITMIAKLYNDIDEMMINHAVCAELYQEARGMRIFLYSILYEGSGRKHCFVSREFYCKFYVVHSVRYLVEYVKLTPWRV